MQPNHSARLKTPWTSKSIPENMRSAGPSNREVVEALQTRVTGMQTQMGQIQRELDGSRSQIVQDEGTMGHLRRRIEELEELVQKQKATIANQSKAISDPRTGRRQQQNQQQNQQNQPGNGIVYPATPHHNHQGLSAPYQTPASMRSQHSVASANVFDGPPPKFELQAVNGAAPAPGPGPGPGPATAPGPSTNAFGNGIPHVTGPRLHFTYAEVEKNSTDLGKRLQELFGKTEQWGQAHANVPNVYHDSRLEKRVKEYIMSVSDASTASHLLGNVKTRYFLVAKAINFYLVNEVLKITAVRGFDAVVDAEIEGLKGQLFPDTPSSLRQLLVGALAAQTEIAKKQAPFAGFSQGKAQEHHAQLWALAGPLTADGSNRAWTELGAIAADAQGLACDMYAVPFEYKFEFVATDETFNPAEMVNRDPAAADAAALRNGEAKVRLGISPAVRIRNDSDNVAVIKQGSLATVLLRQRQRQRQPRREFSSAMFTPDGLILS